MIPRKVFIRKLQAQSQKREPREQTLLLFATNLKDALKNKMFYSRSQ